MLVSTCLRLTCALISSILPKSSWATYINYEPSFKTEPSLVPQLLNYSYIDTNNTSLFAPGYLFFTPMTITWGWGPQLYDTAKGELIWNGNESVESHTQEFRTCDYNGDKNNHICWHETRPGFKSANRIFDATYQEVREPFTSSGSLQFSADGHEFNVLPGGETFLQPVPKAVPMDLRPFAGVKDGLVSDSCFQEVNMTNGEPFFTWCGLDHLKVWESYVFFKNRNQQNQVNFSTARAGRGTVKNPWDYFHINAIDKNEEGDYLVSSRYLDTVLKIAGPTSYNGHPGSIIWKLGGKLGDFRMMDSLNFSRQHHARFIKTGSTETTLSLFDNAWEGRSKNPSSNCSSGKIIRINNSTMEAALVRQYDHPYQKLSAAQGSFQILPNKNALLGWGARPEVSEFTEEGTLLYHFSFNTTEGNPECASGCKRDIYGYRAYKSPWEGKPHHPPKVLAYSRSCTKDSPLIAYASWNGATTFKAWRFFTSSDTNGPWILSGRFPKSGFETKAILGNMFRPYVKVEAVDADDNVLSSANTVTFVPNQRKLTDCDDQGCFSPKHFDYHIRHSRSGSCLLDTITSAAWFALLIFASTVETLEYLYSSFFYKDMVSQRF